MSDIVARVFMYPTERGGRQGPTPSDRFGCPVFFHNVSALAAHGYDCRLLLGELGRAIAPGETIDRVPIDFLSPGEVIPHLTVGVRFWLWEGRHIGEGEIIHVSP
jgi:hypothetical protein